MSKMHCDIRSYIVNDIEKHIAWKALISARSHVRAVMSSLAAC